jgi:hypothetical protein
MRSIIGFQSTGYAYETFCLTRLITTGLLNYLGKRKDAKPIHELAGADGLIDCVFIACDLPYLYICEYFDKLGGAAFYPIHNKVST